ncbi:unnamed protein product [Rotaria sp. Silwood1]|nr:unnamed protein product [Rotaria sp. Silwood1]
MKSDIYPILSPQKLSLTISFILIQEEVTIDSVPRDVEQLLALIRRRLNIQQVPADVTRLTSDDLSQLATVVLTQMRSKWIDIEEMRVQHPLLSPKRNQELIRRLFVNIILICTNIFEHTIQESQIFHDRYVFSHAANMTRLRTLLADRINTLINIHSLREHLAFEMIEEERIKKGLIFEETISKNIRRRLNKSIVLSQHRPDVRDVIEHAGKSYKYQVKDLKYHTKQILHQLVTNMPDVNRFRRLPVVLPPVTREIDSTTPLKKTSSQPRIIKQKSAVQIPKPSLEQEKDETSKIVRRSYYGSLPNLHEKFLSEELDFDFNSIRKSKYKTTYIIREQYFIDEEKKRRDIESTKSISNRADLINLTTQTIPDEREKSDDIPPLIKVLTSSHDPKQRINECKETVLAIAKRRKDYFDELKENVRDEPLCPQPSAIEKTFKNITFRISDITLANFYFQSSFLLTSFPTIFNNYFGDIDDDTVAYLDRNLHIGQQIKEVYEQLLSTIDMNHCFRLDTDKYVVKCPDNLDLLTAQASSTLKKPYAEQINNRSLSKRDEPPWTQYDNDRQRWVLTPDPRRLEQDAEEKKKRNPKNRNKKGLIEPTINLSLVPDPQVIASYKPRDSRQTRDFQTWKDYWSQVHTDNDYLKYLSTQSTDYLHHIFHLHDKLPEDNRLSEENQALLDERDRALKEREDRIAELKERKNKFEQGVWNAESIFLGGLGHDPVLNPQDDPIVHFEQDLEKRKPKSKRIDLFDPIAHEKALSSKQFLTTILNNVKHDNVQKRLEQIWKLLKMTDNDRLHMAVKYSTIEYEKKIESALDAWEFIAQLIVQREKFINDLENFERTASDPNRFFEPGPMGSSKMRLSESRRRTYIYNQLSILEKQITEQWNKIKMTCGDTVTYNGRNYLDKIQFDKLEMLHYLQEERRLNYLHSFTSMGKHSKLDSTFNHVL